MQAQLDQEQIRNIIINELPGVMESDQEVRSFILKITRERYADREKTEDRIDRILDELKHDREKSEKKWEAQEKKWEQERKDQAAKWEAQEKKWEQERKDQAAKWEAREKKWEQERKDQAAKWEAQEKKWEENQNHIRELFNKIGDSDKESKKSYRRLRDSIAALGARWGMKSEASFRNALKAILEESFGVKVIHVNEWDDKGIVFGKPDQVELDILIHNGQLIICEIKSSMSKGDVYLFEKKVRYYETAHQSRCHRMIIVSPMVDSKAMSVADDLDIEVYSHVYDVDV